MRRRRYIQNVIQRKGLSQSDRIIHALSPDFFVPDERTRYDNMLLLSKYAKLITYYTDRNVPDGNWEGFFKHNITFLLIEIAEFDTDNLDSKFGSLIKNLERCLDSKSTLNATSQIFTFVSDVFAEINRWYFIAREHTEFSQEIEKIISQYLNVKYRQFIALSELLDEEIPVKLSLKKKLRLSHPWESGNDGLGADFIRTMDFSISKNVVPVVDEVFNFLLRYIRLIKESASSYVKNHLEESQTVQPHFGLMLAFFDLFEEAQKELNAFTERHLDYYFKQILRERPDDIRPNFVNLVLTLGPKHNELVIDKGELFDAGSNEKGESVLYETTQQSTINKGTVCTMCALLLENLSCDSEIFQTASINLAKSSLDFTGDEYGVPEWAPYNFGFALSSPILMLEEGYRRIKFLFKLQKQSLQYFIDKLAERYTTEDGFVVPEDVNGIIDKLFNIRFSCEEGWFNIPHEKIEIRVPSDEKEGISSRLDVIVLLEPGDPAFTRVLEAGYLSSGKFDFPVVEFHLNPEKSYLYSLFNIVEIESIEIDTEVLGVKNLIVQNDLGPVNINTAFQPFGPMPKLGSTLYIGHRNLFNHLIKDICISIEWLDVPVCDNGFEEYYKGYSYIESNEIFKAKVSFLHNKKWIPDEDQQVVNLFEDVDIDSEDVPVNNHRRIDTIDVQGLRFERSVAVNTERTYNTNSLNGFVKLELCYPPNAFGHKEYPELIQRVINNNFAKKKNDPNPSEPYTPTIKSLAVDYYASHYINLKKDLSKEDRFILLNPYGFCDVGQEKPVKFRFFPELANQTEIYFGLDDLTLPGNISILFNIDEIQVDKSSGDRPIEWHYLSNNSWVRIKPANILLDSTNQLIESGIITFSLNLKIDIESNTILQPGIIWLRCSTERESGFVNSILDVRAQAIEARLATMHNTLPFLPASTISAFKKPVKGIKAVEQPYPSHGGRQEKSKSEFRLSLSERLRHKNRASNLWDIEHLILNEFSFLYKVKCYNNVTSKLELTPGKLLIVVIPAVQDDNTELSAEPRISFSKIKRIESFVKERISPFVTVSVINPTYEEVQVKLDVSFKHGYSEGYYKKTLVEDIRKSLSPWMFNNKVLPDFGTVIHGSAVLNYIQNLEYVDFVENFALFHLVNGEIVNRKTASLNDVIIKTQSPFSLIVSAESHYIGIIDRLTPDGTGINDMIMGADFMVDNKKDERSDVPEGVENDVIGYSFSIDEDVKDGEKTSTFLIRL